MVLHVKPRASPLISCCFLLSCSPSERPPTALQFASLYFAAALLWQRWSICQEPTCRAGKLSAFLCCFSSQEYLANTSQSAKASSEDSSTTPRDDSVPLGTARRSRWHYTSVSPMAVTLKKTICSLGVALTYAVLHQFWGTTSSQISAFQLTLLFGFLSSCRPLKVKIRLPVAYWPNQIPVFSRRVLVARKTLRSHRPSPNTMTNSFLHSEETELL